MTERLRLHGYWRSSASYRVRIALNLKGLAYEQVPVHLVRDGGEQHQAAFLKLNPQGLVPTLQDGVRIVRQSLAIIEYLDELHPMPPLMPSTARDRARVRALALLVACDVHPLCNLRVMQYLENKLSAGDSERQEWMRHWMAEGLASMEAQVEDNPSTGDFCEGDIPSLADCCLVPQLYNARRYGLDLGPYPTLCRIEANCNSLPAFDLARPEKQPDAPPSVS